MRDQRRAIAGILAYGTAHGAATKLNISRHRIRNWLLHDKAFARELKKAINTVYEGTIVQAKSLTEKAMNRLAQLIDSDDEEIAAKAIDKVLSLGFDVDLFQRATHGNDGRSETTVSGNGGGRFGPPSIN